MLGSKKATFSVSGSTTLISRDTAVLGDMHFSGNLDVEGLVQGNIIARGDKDALVRVVHKGRVEGDIRAPSVIINGSVEGDIYSSHLLELTSQAVVKGNVYYTQVEMAAGSEVNGSLTHVVKSKAAAATAAALGRDDPAVDIVDAPKQFKQARLSSAKVD